MMIERNTRSCEYGYLDCWVILWLCNHQVNVNVLYTNVVDASVLETNVLDVNVFDSWMQVSQMRVSRTRMDRMRMDRMQMDRIQETLLIIGHGPMTDATMIRLEPSSHYLICLCWDQWYKIFKLWLNCLLCIHCGIFWMLLLCIGQKFNGDQKC